MNSRSPFEHLNCVKSHIRAISESHFCVANMQSMAKILDLMSQASIDEYRLREEDYQFALDELEEARLSLPEFTKCFNAFRTDSELTLAVYADLRGLEFNHLLPHSCEYVGSEMRDLAIKLEEYFRCSESIYRPLRF